MAIRRDGSLTDWLQDTQTDLLDNDFEDSLQIEW